MKFYCVFSGPLAGSMRESYIKNLGDNVFNTLHSYWYFRGLPDDRIENEFKITKGNIMIDSGAFTAYADATMKRQKDNGKKSKKPLDIDQYIEDYIEWINKWDEYITTFGQMDVIPVEAVTKEDFDRCCKQTWENYKYMISKMKSPKKLLYTYHYGEDPSWLEQALNFRFPDGSAMEYIAFGGLVGKPTKERRKFLDKAFQVIANSSNPNIKVHGFGVSSEKLWKDYPFESCDSFTPGLNTNHGFTFDEHGTFRTSDYDKMYKTKKEVKGLLKPQPKKEEDEEIVTDEERIDMKTSLLVHNIKHWNDLGNNTKKADIMKFKYSGKLDPLRK